MFFRYKWCDDEYGVEGGRGTNRAARVSLNPMTPPWTSGL